MQVDTVMIKDPRDGRVMEVKDIRVVNHPLPKNGEMVLTKCIEFTVVGRNHEWPFWMEHSDFIETNPAIKIREDE